MLIAGSKGFAKQLIHSLDAAEYDNLVLFDNINLSETRFLDQFPLLHQEEEARQHFLADPRFSLGVGNPEVRYKLAKLLTSWGGRLHTTRAGAAEISPFGVTIGEGVNILSGTIIEPCVTVGEGCLLNLKVCITHDSAVGAYTEIGPGAMLLGGCEIGTHCFIGAGAIILPKIKVGDYAIVGAGAVVNRDIPSRQTVIGVPARAKFKL